MVASVKAGPAAKAMRPASRIEAQPGCKGRRRSAEYHDIGASCRVPIGRGIKRRKARIGRESRGPIAGPSLPETQARHGDPTSSVQSRDCTPGYGEETPGRSRESQGTAAGGFLLASQDRKRAV